MKYQYNEKDIREGIIDEIPLNFKIRMKTDYGIFKGKLIINNKDCIGIDEPKDLGGSYFSRDAIRAIRIIGSDNKMSKKEQLLNELEQIKKEFNEKVENIQKQIEEENNKDKWWIPKEGESYCYIGSDGYVERVLNRDKNIDKCKINNLNYFETEQQAERQSFEELLHRKLKKFAYENNEEIDWDNKEQYKYIILCHNNELECFGFLDNFGRVCFSSEEIAKKAIKEFKDDLIRYFLSDK
jgi:hypothetical protein